MPLRIPVSGAHLLAELDAEMYGLALRLSEPATGVVPLADDAAAEIGRAVRDALLADGGALNEEFVQREFHVAIGDGLVPADTFADEEVRIAMTEVSGRVGRVLTSSSAEADGADGVACLVALARPPQRPEDGDVALLADAPPTASVDYVLPLVLAGSAGALEEASGALSGRLAGGTPELERAVRRAFGTVGVQAVSCCGRLDGLGDDAGPGAAAFVPAAGLLAVDAEDAAGMATAVAALADESDRIEDVPEPDEVLARTPAEDVPFLVMVLRQESRDGEESHTFEDLALRVDEVRTLQSFAADPGNGVQYVYCRGVVLVVTADFVYAGFKTIDELGRELDGTPDPRVADGATLAAWWEHWYVHGYLPTVETLRRAGLRVQAFAQVEWAKALAAEIEGVGRFSPGTGLLAPLPDVLIEPSDHELAGEGGRSPARVLFRLVLAGGPSLHGRASGDSDPDNPDQPVSVLCAIVRLVDAYCVGVSQTNFYATTPAAEPELRRCTERDTASSGLPVDTGYTGLAVCDRHLQLVHGAAPQRRSAEAPSEAAPAG
jgi:hypothetical protein